MKQCSKCKQQLELNAYSKNKTCKDGLSGWCKECKKQDYQKNIKYYIKTNNKKFTSVKLPHHIVYLLPEHNYVGVTDNPYFRMNWHKNISNRNTDNWTELAKFNTREEALKCEAEYHAQGYEGAK